MLMTNEFLNQLNSVFGSEIDAGKSPGLYIGTSIDMMVGSFKSQHDIYKIYIRKQYS